MSPAHSGGKRAQLILNPRAAFDLARRLHAGEGVALGEVFSFLSGLYFRGKLAYARAFARPPAGLPGAVVITANRGLIEVDRAVTLRELKAFSRASIDPQAAGYRKPLQRDLQRMVRAAPASCQFILLGSISTPKYVEILLAGLGSSLFFPLEFIGRGDMSRGGLMLRCADSGEELKYAPVAGAMRRGKRPPRLQPRSWKGWHPPPLVQEAHHPVGQEPFETGSPEAYGH